MKGLLSEQAEQALIEKVIIAVNEGLSQLTEKSDSKMFMNKKELCEFLSVANNTFDEYLVTEMPFVRVGSKKVYIRTEVINHLKRKQETMI